MTKSKSSILHVYPQLNCGGTEMVIYNLIKFSDHERFSFSILVQRVGEQDKVFEELGCKIVLIPFKDSRSYYQELASFFTNNRFVAVHTHMHNEMGIVLKAAKKGNVKHRLAHSHNARVDIPRVLWPLRIIKHYPFEKYATEFFGCSELALRWLFPLNWKKGKVIYNAIDLGAFSYDENKRTLLRKEIKAIETTKVVINVGRCTEQKNQRFILDRAKDLENEDFRFVIIGEGPLLNDLRQQVAEESIQNVFLLGKRFDVAEWLSAADFFIFPSIYEGLGIVAIEAQASGLVVLATDTIPAEANMGMETFHRLSLSNPSEWNEFLMVHSNSYNRNELSHRAFDSNYNIHTVAKFVNDIYLS